MPSLSPEVFNRIQALYGQLLAIDAVTNSTVNCAVSIGRILGDLNSNCNIHVSNVCRAEGNNLALLDVAVNKVISLYKNIDSTSLSSVYNAARQDCVSQAELLQSITIQDLNLGICKPKFPISFNFINSGDAVSNCVILSLLSVVNDDTVPVKNTLAQSLEDNFLWIASSLIAAGVIVISLLFLRRKKVTIVWRRI